MKIERARRGLLRRICVSGKLAVFEKFSRVVGRLACPPHGTLSYDRYSAIGWSVRSDLERDKRWNLTRIHGSAQGPTGFLALRAWRGRTTPLRS